MFRFGKAAFAIAVAASLTSMAPVHAFSLGGQSVPGVLTAYVCDDDAEDTISSQIVNINYGGHFENFITSQIIDNDFARDDNDDSAGAVLDGIGGTFFSSFSIDIENDTIPSNFNRIKFKFFGNDIDANHLTVNKTLNNASATTGTGLSNTSPPVGFTRYTFTTNQLGSNFFQLQRVYIELRTDGRNTNIGPLTFGHVRINSSSQAPTLNFQLSGCPININD